MAWAVAELPGAALVNVSRGLALGQGSGESFGEGVKNLPFQACVPLRKLNLVGESLGASGWPRGILEGCPVTTGWEGQEVP